MAGWQNSVYVTHGRVHEKSPAAAGEGFSLARKREMVFLAVLSIAGAAGGISLLLTQGGPAWLRLMAATLVTFVWPGWALISLVRPRAPLPPVERLAVATAASAAPLALEALAAYSLGLTMQQLQVAHVLAIGLLSVGAIVRTARCRIDPDGARGDRSDYVILAAAAVFAVALWFAAPSYGPDLHERSDGWYHLGYMTFLSSAERITPNCAFYEGAPPDPRYPYSASHLSMASVVALSALPVLEVWAFFAWAFSLAALGSVYFFVRMVFHHRVLALTAVVVVIAGMLMPDIEPIRSLSFKLSASPAVTLRYPYPYSLATRVLAPVLLGLVALHLRQRHRWTPWLIAVMAFSAPAFHVSQVLYLPLFFISLCIVALVAGLPTIRDAAKLTALALGSLLPFAVIIALAFRPAAQRVATAGTIFGYPVSSEGLHAIEPQSVLFPWVLGAVAIAYLAVLCRRARPSGIVMAAVLFLIVLLPLNPLLASIAKKYVTYALLTRLYYPVPNILYYGGFFILAGLAASWAHRFLESRGLRGSRFGALVPAVTVVVFLALVWQVLQVLPIGLTWLGAAAKTSSALPLIIGFAIAVLPLVARFTARSPLLLLPESPRDNGVLVAVVIGLVAMIGVQAVRGKATYRPPRNDLHRWNTDATTGGPRFLEALGGDAEPFSAVVYTPDPFVAELTPAFGRQYVLFYDLNSNPGADLEGRQQDWGDLGDQQVPPETRRKILAKRHIRYIAVSTVGGKPLPASMDELVDHGAVVYRDSTATVWRISPALAR